MTSRERDPELDGAIACALRRARDAGRRASVFDLFSALLDTPEVRALVGEVGGDAEALASALQCAGDVRPKMGALARWWPAPAAAFRQPIVIARRRTRGRRQIGPADVFAAGFDAGDRDLHAVLERAGLSRSRVLRWLCGRPQGDVPDAAPEGDSLELVMLNDDYTTMETVVRILGTVLAFDGPRAYRTMLAVHHEGSSCIGRYERAEAIRLARAATTMAEAEGAPLRIVLRCPGSAVQAARDDAVPPASSATGPRRGFLAALAGRLTARLLSPEGVASSDGMIATCAAVTLAVWLALDRYAAGPTAEWTWAGLSGWTWYAAGLIALAWLMHRIGGTPEFRSLLAALVGMVPLTLALALAISSFVPERMARYAYLMLACAAFAKGTRFLAALGAVRPGRAILVGLGFVAAFAWATEHTYVGAHFWYADTEDDEPSGWSKTERLLFEQADRIDAAADRLRAGESGRPSVFFLGFAGVGEQKVFAEEAKLAERVIAQLYGAAGRSLLLLNDQRDLESRPLATVHGLCRALRRIGQRMDSSKDVLFLLLTSHGSERQLSVSNRTWPLEQLDAATLRKALDDSGIKWRVIVISACHSGAFIPALADESTAIFTSAGAGRASFGCGDDREITEFGAAFVRDALPRATSLEAAFEQAKAALAERERRQHVQPSSPQARVGAAISAHWQRIEAQRDPGLQGAKHADRPNTPGPD
jgi:ATP-dependent Clp protease adapter protein ClpS